MLVGRHSRKEIQTQLKKLPQQSRFAVAEVRFRDVGGSNVMLTIQRLQQQLPAVLFSGQVDCFEAAS